MLIAVSSGISVDTATWFDNYKQEARTIAKHLDLDWQTVALSNNNSNDDPYNFNASTTYISEALTQVYASYFNQKLQQKKRTPRIETFHYLITMSGILTGSSPERVGCKKIPPNYPKLGLWSKKSSHPWKGMLYAFDLHMDINRS